MKPSRSIAEAALSGDEAVLSKLLSRPLIVARNNFVERPWGGSWMRQYKGLHPLPEQARVTGLGIGEAFELAAFDDDEEASRFPSYLVCDDGSRISLPRLLERHGARILGDRFVHRYGARLPLLPKTLDIKELLSVQGHPPGHTEIYIILDAEPGATLAIGFREDMVAEDLERKLTSGLERQARLVDSLARSVDLQAFQQLVAPWFATRAMAVDSIADELAGFLEPATVGGEVERLLDDLKDCYWEVLDSLNAIEAVPGQVLYNATPRRLLAEGQLPSAEVHALGNPERREVLALEIRLPGTTYRAWDNVRFPQREVDVNAAIAALNLRATTAADFVCEETEDPERPGVSWSVDSEFFRVEHLRPSGDVVCRMSAGRPACLHVISGEAAVNDDIGSELVRLRRGDTALVPVALDGCSFVAAHEAHIVSVTLPQD